MKTLSRTTYAMEGLIDYDPEFDDAAPSGTTENFPDIPRGTPWRKSKQETTVIGFFPRSHEHVVGSIQLQPQYDLIYWPQEFRSLGSRALTAGNISFANPHVLIQHLHVLDKDAFNSQFKALLNSEPIEDGIYHPAERLIQEAIKASQFQGPLWIRDFIISADNASLAATALQCASRFPFFYFSAVAEGIINHSLQSSSVEIREAAITAVEQWEDPRLLQILKNQQEPVPWLSQFAKQVIKSLSRDGGS